jgi:uncharacterized protein YfdQ (DUF2303 family)
LDNIMDNYNKTEAAAVAELTREGLRPELQYAGGAGWTPLVYWPKGQRVESLERYLEFPLRKRGVILLRDHISFVAYVDLHREAASTVVYADIDSKGGSFTAILDGHAFGQGAGKARWGGHVCKYVCNHSEEWLRWMGANRKGMAQLEMAQYIEDNMVDIVDPEAARMLEVVKTLEATQGATFKSLVRLENGDRGLAFERQTKAHAGVNGEMEIPSRFAINIPVFENSPQYRVECHFRYNISEGVLRMGYELVRPHRVVELALVEAKGAITSALEGSGIPVLLGSASLGVPPHDADGTPF